MATSIPPILVQLQADVSQLKAGIAQAEASLKGLDGTVAKSSSAMTGFMNNAKKVGATLGVAFAAQQVVQFGKDIIMAASDMNESIGKMNVVFGQNAKQVEAWANTSATAMGLSKQSAIEAAGTYGNLFQAFGLGQPAAQKMSTSLVQLASDMASFNNTSVDDAILALRSGLSGETEPLKRFGVALSDARLKTEAMAMGLIKSTSEALTPAAKSQAAYSLIMKDTTLAQGDFARTASGTANTMRTLKAQMDNAKAALGAGLLPVFQGLLLVLKPVIAGLAAFGNFLAKHADDVKVFTIAIAGFAAALGVYTVATNAARIATAAFEAVMAINPFVAVGIAIGVVAVGLYELYKRSETFRKAVITVAKVAITAFAAIIPIVGQVYEAILKVSTGPLRLLLSALSHLPGVGKYAKAGLDLMNKGLNGISDFADGAAKKATGLIASLDKVGTAADKNAAKVKTATTGIKTTTTGGGKGSAVSTKDLDAIKKAQTNFTEDLLKAKEKYMEDVASAEKDRAKAEIEARKDNAKELINIAKDYSNTVKDIEANLQDKLTSLRADADKKRTELTKQAADKQLSIIQQSMDRLRNAFASGTAFSISDAFKGKTSGGFLDSMKKQLADAKALQEGAAYLSGQGYAQTFIEEVVKAGPTAGLQMVDELKKATPEQQKVIQSTFLDLEAIQNTGLDTLAKSMNNGANLATSELRQAYDQVAIDLKNSLADVDAELKASMAEANADYLKAMTAAGVARDEKIAESNAKMAEAIAAAKEKYDAALADASATLQKSLLQAQKDFQKAIDETSLSTTKKIALLKTQLQEVAALMASLQMAQATAAAMASVSTTPYITSNSNPSGFIGPVATTTNNYNINTTGFNMTNPSAVTSSVVGGIKYGTAVTVSGGYSGIPKTVTPAKSTSTFGSSGIYQLK